MLSRFVALSVSLTRKASLFSPTGSVFEYLRSNRSFVVPPTRVGLEPGAGTSHREAQTLTLYGDDILLGVWPCASRARS